MLKIDRLGVLAALIDEKSMGSVKIECLVLNLSWRERENGRKEVRKWVCGVI